MRDFRDYRNPMNVLSLNSYQNIFLKKCTPQSLQTWNLTAEAAQWHSAATY